MSRRFALALLATGCVAPAQESGSDEQVMQAFAQNDCCGRLVHSEVSNVGEIRSGSRSFAIYELWFVNPQNLHGMRRLAVTENGRFLGSYVISSSASPILEGDRVRFICENGRWCDGDDFAIEGDRIPARLWVDGEISQLEDTI